DAPGARGQKARHEIEQRRLPAAARTEQADEFARRDGEVDPGHDPVRPERDADALELDLRTRADGCGAGGGLRLTHAAGPIISRRSPSGRPCSRRLWSA